jgi:hypothetical protein
VGVGIVANEEESKLRQDPQHVGEFIIVEEGHALTVGVYVVVVDKTVDILQY